MRGRRLFVAGLLLVAGASGASRVSGQGTRFEVSYPAARSAGPLDGRLLLLLSTDASAEPRFQVSDDASSQLVFGMDVEGWRPGQTIVFPDTAVGSPLETLASLPTGTYRMQVLLNRYETFRLKDGRVLKLPPDRGEGQQWNRKPGNLYSPVAVVRVRGGSAAGEGGNAGTGGTDVDRGGDVASASLTEEIQPIPDAPETEWIKHVRVRSKLLSDFWGRDMYLGAWVLLPKGFAEHPDARYPIAVFHGHFPHEFDGWRATPPDMTTPCVYSERFRLDCYNHVQDSMAYELFKDWNAPDFPRMLVVQIQHANPYYDDSYAVNSANLGPYGDAINRELIPEIERRFRGLGTGWSRFLYGGSTGGWEALAVQLFYPDDYNGTWAACPDPIDFRAFTVVDLYADTNAYHLDSTWRSTPRPGRRDWLGHVLTTLKETNQLELALGTRTRSGQQWDIWEAVFSPVGPDGYPARIWDKKTGHIDPDVANYWREHYDLGHMLETQWATLGPKLAGTIHIYAGDMDNYYLNDAVYMVQDVLENTRGPGYGGEVDYGDRAEHCWNGDHTRPNALSRLRYIQMFAPRIVERIRATAPPGADTTSWRYR